MANVYWSPMVKLQIKRDEKFIGPGCRELLALIKGHGSVRLAAQAMDMSYTKAWRILNTLEVQAGFAAVARRHGGAGGGESTLTPEGERLLSRYEAYERECQDAVQAIFRRHFKEEAGVNE